MKLKKVTPYDHSNESDRSFLAVLNRLEEGQESYDETCSHFSPDLLGCMERFVTRINGCLICRDGKEWMLFNGDCFVLVPQWVVVSCIDHFLSEGLLREATLLGVNKAKLESIADKVGLERTVLKGKPVDKVLTMLKNALVADKQLSPSETVSILTELNELAENNAASKMLQTLSKKVRDGSPFNALLKQLPQARGIYRQVEELNADGNQLVCKNGITLDLRKIATPELMARPSTQFDLNTQCVNAVYNPLATRPTFQAQFEHIIDNEDVQPFAKMVMGTCVDGSGTKEMMFIINGAPGSGKSLLITALESCLGDYATRVSGDFFLKNTARGKGDATPHLVKIVGKRLVVASEPDGNAPLDESMIKTLTGEPLIAYRDFYSSEKTFSPVCTMIMTSNKLPRLSGNDSAITSRRLALYHKRGSLDQSKMKSTKELTAQLEAENSGILNFLLEGYRESKKYARIPIPASVREELSEYQHEYDSIARFFEEENIQTDMYSSQKGVTIDALYTHYSTWAETEKDKYPMSKSAFSSKLKSKGFKQIVAKTSGKATRVWLGIHLPETVTHKKSSPSTNGHKNQSNGHTDDLVPVTVSLENDLSDLREGNF